MTIFILGAGPAGIACAYEISKKTDENIVLIEARSSAGGMCRSWNWKKHVLDTGPHIFHAHDPYVVNTWKNCASDLLIESKFYSGNLDSEYKICSYPLSYEEIARFDNYEAILSELRICNNSKSYQHATNFNEFMIGKVGPTLTDKFFKIYPQKVWGISTKEMSADWAPQRISIREKIEPFFQNQYTAVAAKGTGSVMKRFVDIAIKNGVDFKPSTTVKAFTLDESKSWVSTIITQKCILPVKPTDFIVNTLPLVYTASLLGVESSLRYRGVLSVYAEYHSDIVLPAPYSWLYVADKKWEFNRITDFRSLGSKAPAEATNILCFESTYISELSPSELKLKFEKVKRQIMDFSNHFLKLQPADFNFNFERYVYPIMDANYRSEKAFSQSLVDSIQNMSLFGNVSDFYYGDIQGLFSKAHFLSEDLIGKSSSVLFKRRMGNQVDSDMDKPEESPMKSHILANDYKPQQVNLIAEIGINHNGDINLAKEMVLAAKLSGANYVKFQLYSQGSRVLETNRNKFDYEDNMGEENGILDILEGSRLSAKHVYELDTFCNAHNVALFFTVFDEVSLSLVLKLDIFILKLASMDLNNIWLHDKIAACFRGTVILSTGMSTLQEILSAVSRYLGSSCNLVVMHCTSSYPAPDLSLNLGQIRLLRQLLPDSCEIGFSDHSSDNLASVASCMLGISWIERHFTTDRALSGPDNKISLLPHEFKDLSQSISRLPVIYGTNKPLASILPSELLTYSTQKKSLHYKHNFEKGYKITASRDLIFAAPPTGMSQEEFDALNTLILSRSVLMHTPTSHDHF